MKNKRRTFSVEFKLDTVLELLRAEKSAAQICRERQITESLLYKWRDRFVSRAASLFDDQRSTPGPNEAARIAELERMVGRLTMEVDILKKAKSWFSAPPPSSDR